MAEILYVLSTASVSGVIKLLLLLPVSAISLAIVIAIPIYVARMDMSCEDNSSHQHDDVDPLIHHP